MKNDYELSLSNDSEIELVNKIILFTLLAPSFYHDHINCNMLLIQSDSFNLSWFCKCQNEPATWTIYLFFYISVWR